MSIYRPHDIRGDARTELTPELYRRWGLGLGRQAGSGAKFVVGGDVRASTPEFLAALGDGLRQTGVDLVDLGTLPTPMIVYARRRLNAAGCGIVTACHDLPERNGLKWLIGERPPGPGEVQVLRETAEHPNGKSPEAASAAPRQLDVSFDYVAWLQEAWAETPRIPRPVVLDPMYGCWACRARRYLQAVFPHSFFSSIHDAPNGALDGARPDCTRPELLEELSQTVEHQRAFLGIAFDGDGDRVAFVDDQGNVLTAEETTSVLLQSLGEGLRGETFVYDMRLSSRVPEAAAALGLEPIAAGSGDAFVRGAMLKSGAIFGAEADGHYYFRDLAGSDDALATACRMIALLASSGKTLSDIRRQCPEVFITPDLHVHAEGPEQDAILQRVREQWADSSTSHLDGLRVSFPEGWALVRRCDGEPCLAFRFEADGWGGIADLVWGFCESLPQIGDDLWRRYQESLGLGEKAE